ncbi:RFX7-like protein [Mya arenaria]|uniref:RFX7-like protein n=1 Tax=Mya arenaria TaxID=6604 RepID=A0ABY7G621_MYAAR|nr:RFX7-like protein [Mya arenaria]
MASQHRVFAALLSQPANPIHPAISTTTVQQPNSVLEKKARDANVGKRYMKIHDGLESSIRTPPSCLPMSNRKEQGEAFTWIRTHFEEHTDVCMPKAQVYDEYKLFCEQHGLRALCNADFGKVMRQVFPDINTRRLGQRGQYFYGGLRKRQDFEEPSLPELEISNKHIELDSSVVEGEVFKSSCELVLEWAEKVLDMRFDSVPSVAEHLVGNMYVNTRSVAAFTLIGALQDSGKNNLKET